ncbi:methylated-DNA--[protein]-cysteine S-methyltransferase [Streptacidiphilus sp. PB12-B1b]|uniref:methylated-DNA--[protein]-cysteine S-methyltransferase n=1 Tax=Streptacidiphilus sp. PB12-B1b TaxID=2705012 RepID=UPI0015FE5F36|nr:methylated-DNA--[protein]-cysteine S-methyltransferase [Streptacidiphilus sp. PB12-B1b]QMU75994.1 methylated-DNA--[protein]-cysteine S-methyltransferase [Streptacidiphilus sp. PB12-B1b]
MSQTSRTDLTTRTDPADPIGKADPADVIGTAVPGGARPPLRYTTAGSPLGPLLLVADEDGALTALLAPGTKGQVNRPDPAWQQDPAPFTDAVEQLAAYFDGDLKEFALPLAPRGSEFRRRVWEALESVPYGETATYGELAAAAGQPPSAVRAVAGAIGANPLLIVRPCHRVIGANGSLTGFAAGLDAKRLLLRLESADRTLFD